MKRRVLTITLCLASLVSSPAQAAAPYCPGGAPAGALSSPKAIWPHSGANYYSFTLDNGSRVHLVVLDTRSKQWRIRPALAQPTTSPTSVIAARENASAATNAGYFNLKGDIGASASYVIIDGVTVGDPHKNKTLMDNPKLQPYMEQILNRSEVRFLEQCGGKRRIQIAKHNDPLPADTKLISSLQAGPRLVPSVDAVEEAFVRSNPDRSTFDSISVHKPAARTAFGITPDGYAMMITVAGKGQDPESSGITLDELAGLLKNLGCSEALNLDGGASSTMFVRLSPSAGAAGVKAPPPGAVVVGKSPETLVKSILMLEPEPRRR